LKLSTDNFLDSYIKFINNYTCNYI